jgi:hypothetical protein
MVTYMQWCNKCVIYYALRRFGSFSMCNVLNTEEFSAALLRAEHVKQQLCTTVLSLMIGQ